MYDVTVKIIEMMIIFCIDCISNITFTPITVTSANITAFLLFLNIDIYDNIIRIVMENHLKALPSGLLNI